MRCCSSALVAVLMLVFAGCSEAPREPALTIELDRESLNWIGDQVFRNECAGREACLVHWNQGEAFPSLGIGHFIWYPQGAEGPFTESFPALVAFLSERGVAVPAWLAGLAPFDAPWPSRDAFLADSDADQVRALRDFLAHTKAEQAGFLVQRARSALDRVVAAAPPSEQHRIARDLEALTATPGGVYALIDYVNFKGEGLVSSERYNDQGWGLLQVLQGMSDRDGEPALQGFRESAQRVLTRRAENAPQALERQRWLAGWLNRLDTYREPGASTATD